MQIKFVHFLLLLLLPLFANAQISNDDAEVLYQRALGQYEQGNYRLAYESMNALQTKMNGWNPRTAYLAIRSMQAIFTNAGKDSLSNDPKTFEKVNSALTLTNHFFTLVNKETYPVEKYQHIAAAKLFFEDLKNKYGYQSERQPSDAIDFLNETVKKFPPTQILRYWGYPADELRTEKWDIKNIQYEFTLKGSMLYIHGNAIKTDDKPKFRGVRTIDICIDLATCNLQLKQDNNYVSSHPYYNETEKKYQLVGPMITNAKGDDLYAFLRAEESMRYDKHSEFTPEEKVFKNWSLLIPVQKTDQSAFYILSLFNCNSMAFKEADYERRIVSALLFLMDSFKPTDCDQKAKQCQKSKF